MGGGLIRAARQPFEPFRRLYTETENRTLHLSRIAVSPDTYTLLHDRFESQLARQNAQFEMPERLHRDRALLETLTDKTAVPPLRVRGLGLFEPSESNRAEDPTLAELRSRAAAHYGEAGLASRAEAVRAAIRSLHPPSPDDPLPENSGSPTPWRYRYADRYHDLHASLESYRLLQRAAPLRGGAYHTPQGREFRLNPEEIAALRDFSRRLADSVLATLDHPRPDQGPGLIVALARLEAVGKSLRYGRLVFLDTLTEQDTAEQPWRDAAPLFSAADADFRLARRELANAGALDEVGYSLLENAANRRLNALDALAGQAPFLPLAPTGLMPTRPARPSEIVRPALDTQDAKRAAEAFRAAEDAYGERLRQLYGYHLVTRNCVTEIFRTLDEALGRHGNNPVQASQTRLGGHIEPFPTNAIPFVSSQNVERQYRVAETFDIASRRSRYLGHLDTDARLAEISTLSSAIYQPNAEDSWFLFFTDTPVLARPLFGAANFAAGGLEALAGLAASPWDSGRTFYSGLRGMFISLPELAFVNIRKGSFH